MAPSACCHIVVRTLFSFPYHLRTIATDNAWMELIITQPSVIHLGSLVQCKKSHRLYWLTRKREAQDYLYSLPLVTLCAARESYVRARVRISCILWASLFRNCYHLVFMIGQQQS
uniref:Uncharacterized protein n=1 Tax=Rhipicephalus zambeziensis TaxID=60191 RepID=A0A224YKR6_9ACAR